MPSASDSLPVSYAASDGFVRTGWVAAVGEHRVEVRALGLRPGVLVRLGEPPETIGAVVRSVDRDTAICTPLSTPRALGPGAPVTSDLARPARFVGAQLLGHVVDAWGRGEHRGSRVAETIALELGARVAISEPLVTGVTAIDAFATLGHGQRVALFAGAGVGKTTLLRDIVSHANVDARVVALIGERAREAIETIAALQASPAWTASTIIYAAAEESAMRRWSAAETAVAQARALAASGARVLLAVDSMTRVAQAWRDLAVSAGETLAARGYPASLASALARLVEPVGNFERGGVTGIFAVLSEGDDRREPVTDTLRSLLDGHLELSRALVEAGRFPAVDVLRSLSRLMPALVDAEHARAAVAVRRGLAALERAGDLLALGAYVPGGDAFLDAAVNARDEMARFVHDDGVGAPFERTRASLIAIAAKLSA